MKIDDNTPYIVVDNKKIAPIRRIAPEDPWSQKRESSDERPFGVVDRVTISDAAREKLRQMEALAGDGSVSSTYLDKKVGTRILPILSPPPKRIR